MAKSKQFIVIFVEGETEKAFYQKLIEFYKKNSKTDLLAFKIYNVKGISRFENQVTSKLKLEILKVHEAKNLKVVCCYDTDVFELGTKPPTNWANLKKKVKELGITEFAEVKASKMIEDWFLKDIDGICNFLKIDVPKKIDGQNGLKKIQHLFKRGNSPKIYQKGSSEKFLASLNIEKIRNQLKGELISFETSLNVTLTEEPKKKKKK
jgi:hypothetical protein